jgi:hypothetical protein
MDGKDAEEQKERKKNKTNLVSKSQRLLLC